MNPNRERRTPNGLFRSFVTVQLPPGDGGTDDYGAPLTDWQDLYVDVPCRFETLTGRELIAARQVVGEADVRITIRYMPLITDKARLVIDGAIYDIGYVEDVEMAHFELRMLASTGLTQG